MTSEFQSLGEERWKRGHEPLETSSWYMATGTQAAETLGSLLTIWLRAQELVTVGGSILSPGP